MSQFVFGNGLQQGGPRRRPPFFRTKKIAIIGCTYSHIHAPYFDPSWTIIAHPATRKLMPVEPEWWFDMHPPGNFNKGKNWHMTYPSWLKSLQTPIFMQRDWPEIPMAVAYPKTRVLAEFRPYFTNHVAWMIALAMTEDATHIGLYGCEYKHEQERGQQRGSCEYWLGMFEGRGGHVVLPPGCSLLADPKELYGYESHDPETGALREMYKGPSQRKVTVDPQKMKPQLTFLNPDSAEGRPPLRKLPDCDGPAWERSGLKVHQ